MIPPHTCTPFCDGQRYCVEPGTHTIGVAVRRGFTETDFRTDGVLGKIFIRAVECPDLPRSIVRGQPSAWVADQPDFVGYLVTVCEKETECSKSS